MSETPDTHAQFKPHSVILISRTPARKNAIKALIRTVSPDIPFFVAANYAEVKQLVATWEDVKALVVVDGVSLDEQTILEITALKEDFPETRCLLLIEYIKDPVLSSAQPQDKVLMRYVPGNEFINEIRTLLEFH